MIKRLRRRFIFVSMISVIAVLTVIIGGINVLNYSRIDKKSDKILSILVDNGGNFPTVFPIVPDDKNGIGPETPFASRFFSVTLDKNDHKVLDVDLAHVAGVTVETACKYALSLARSEKAEGVVDDYKFLNVQNDKELVYIFLDRSQDLFAAKTLLKVSILIYFLSLVLVFVLVLILSKIVLKPVEQSYTRQKSFITNASHDIKTPLAVIGAQADVIEIENGQSPWVNEIKNQVGKLNQLTEKLVFLSKMEEDAYGSKFLCFNFSVAVEEICCSYINLAKFKNADIISEIEENVKVYGDQDTLEKALTLILDNAVKYVVDGGKIKISCQAFGKYCKLVCENDCEAVEVGEHSELFERFYRMDKSRNGQTGGHGIGLSVVKAIVDAHKGKVSADSADGKSLKITVLLKTDK